MSVTVGLVDHGVGNLLSVQRAFAHEGAKVTLVRTPEAVAAAERLVLPGVGAFGDCLAALERLNLVAPILQYAASGRPLLGICVGMQLLFDTGTEFGRHRGLGLLAGEVVGLPQQGLDGERLKRPHIGWAPLRLPPGARADHWNGTVLADLAPGESTYFLHSFAAVVAHPGDCLAESPFGGHRFVAAVRRDNLSGTQFHPEKSGPVGLRIIRRFLSE